MSFFSMRGFDLVRWYSDLFRESLGAVDKWGIAITHTLLIPLECRMNLISRILRELHMLQAES